jgi:hypothetical protein
VTAWYDASGTLGYPRHTTVGRPEDLRLLEGKPARLDEDTGTIRAEDANACGEWEGG